MTAAWKVNALRLTLFSTQAVAVSDKDWTAITSQEESETRQVVLGGRTMSGRFGGGQLQLSALGTRVDIRLVAVAGNNPEQPPSPVIGDWLPTLETFVDATSGYLKHIPFPIVRIAFGATLLAETADRIGAYEILKSNIKSVKINAQKSQDFLYRINWPVRSKVDPNIYINRLTNWGSLQFVRKLMQLTGTNLEVAPGDIAYAAQLEIDHNTQDLNLRPFEAAERIPIFEELVALAKENADRGEITVE
jgi:hypothetical protein